MRTALDLRAPKCQVEPHPWALAIINTTPWGTAVDGVLSYVFLPPLGPKRDEAFTAPKGFKTKRARQPLGQFSIF